MKKFTISKFTIMEHNKVNDLTGRCRFYIYSKKNYYVFGGMVVGFTTTYGISAYYH